MTPQVSLPVAKAKQTSGPDQRLSLIPLVLCVDDQHDSWETGGLRHQKGCFPVPCDMRMPITQWQGGRQNVEGKHRWVKGGKTRIF